jgi:hypothetical protein
MPTASDIFPVIANPAKFEPPHPMLPGPERADNANRGAGAGRQH